jgi:hypothetical protein
MEAMAAWRAMAAWISETEEVPPSIYSRRGHLTHLLFLPDREKLFSALLRYRTYLINRNHRWARLRKQQTSITVYRLLTKENKLPFPLSIFSKNMLKWKHIFTYIYIYMYIYMYIYIYPYIYIYMLLFQTENGRRKPRLFSLIRLSFAHHADGSLSFSHLFTKK